jgi:predicted nucleic acid-binding protein
MRQMAWFEKFIECRCKVLPINEKIARHAGILRGEFRRQGIIRTQADLLIASSAAEYDLILATRNGKDFEQCGILIYNPFG